MSDLLIREADSRDATAIAGLHADSWRRHYRGAYSDAFLDGDVLENRLAVWTPRLARPSADTRTIIAEHNREIVGFVYVVLGDDAVWGAFIENLHVRHALKRRGVGSRLLALAAQAVSASGEAGLYLWVFEQNTAARGFYEARGAGCVERAPVPPPGGDSTRLNGNPIRLRYAWRDASKVAH
jgi:ribosomal protein S18 acetylase RimI-like enzyme